MSNRVDIPCIPNPECKYFGTERGCFTDTHHIYKQSEARTKLEKQFCALAMNCVELCRVVHEEWEATVGWPEYPPKDVMQSQVDSA